MTTDLTDDALLLGAARGDAAAFSTFYRRNAEQVAAFFYRRIACPHTAADLTAETFAAALTSVGRFRSDRGTAKAWLYGIAHNQLRQWARRGRVADSARRRLGIETPILSADDIERIETLVDFEPLRVVIVDALAELKPVLREALVLRVAEERPYEEVAERLGCSVGAARVRVSRALAKLEAAIEVAR
jgi:RNA polymerase sigma factor (sigma-70 family)